ncbi:MarR family transcriptional regulator [Salinirubellus sp. GCM10025818]|uniref:MarR family transcriptional regulator n=1 Tax=Salinirubellus TaxID=2162630 RepID=UPI0030D627E5
MDRKRGDGGAFGQRISDSDVLDALHEQPDPVATAGELAEVLDVSSETVRRHLTELHERGLVDRKTVGARAVVWWALDADGSAAPAAPLRGIVGLLDGEVADAARERSKEWREAFDGEVDERLEGQ